VYLASGPWGQAVVPIVISYRSTDATAAAADIGRRLISVYGKDAVLIEQSGVSDTDTSVEDVLLLVIGPRWLGPSTAGRPAIHDGSDPIRCRIERALQSERAIIPVTVDGSRSPRAIDLPETIRSLSTRPAIELHGGRDFAQNFERLKAAIDHHLHGLPTPCSDPMPAAPQEPTPLSPIPRGTSEEARVGRTPADGSAPATTFDRASPEHWIQHVAAERQLIAGDAPLIMISYASEDLPWVDELQAFIDPRIEHLRDPDKQSYELWQFSNGRRGTVPGDAFPTVVAEKMWRCRAALILLSKSYFSSIYCRQIELPFLMWRRQHHGLLCMPVRLGALPTDRVRLPTYSSPAGTVFLDELIDDRQAPADFAASPHRDLTLKQLKERGYESEIERRFSGVAHLIVEHLKAKHGAIDD
jgi:TIR domain-containing protein